MTPVTPVRFSCGALARRGPGGGADGASILPAGPGVVALEMMKRLVLACLAAAGLAACSAEAPEPQPDPALVERIALANTADPDAPKLEKADRIVAAVDRSEPDRLAGAAERLLER